MLRQRIWWSFNSHWFSHLKRSNCLAFSGRDPSHIFTICIYIYTICDIWKSENLDNLINLIDIPSKSLKIVANISLDFGCLCSCEFVENIYILWNGHFHPNFSCCVCAIAGAQFRDLNIMERFLRTWIMIELTLKFNTIFISFDWCYPCIVNIILCLHRRQSNKGTRACA